MNEKEPRQKEKEQPEEDDWDDDWEELDEETEQFPRMSFLDHLDELRSRLFKMVVCLLLAIIVSWSFVEPVWSVLEGPAREMLKNAQEKSLTLTTQAQKLKFKFERMPPLPEELRGDERFELFRSYVNQHLREQSEQLEQQIRDLLVAKDSKLMQTAIGEAFFLKVKVAFMTGITMAFPYLVFQIWAFVAPGLYRRERMIAIPFIVFSTFFFIGGLTFGYYVAVPFAGTFLMGFGTDFVQLITINKYMDFLITMMMGLGIVFEIPMAIFLLSKMGIATPRWLVKNFRYAVIVIVIIAAVVTPTGDPVNLAIFSLPMILLYWVGVGVAAIWGPKHSRWEEEEWGDDEDEEDGGDDDEDEDEGDEEDNGDDDDGDDGGGVSSKAGLDVNPDEPTQDDPYAQFYGEDEPGEGSGTQPPQVEDEGKKED